jgi:hypothetical protein
MKVLVEFIGEIEQEIAEKLLDMNLVYWCDLCKEYHKETGVAGSTLETIASDLSYGLLPDSEPPIPTYEEQVAPFAIEQAPPKTTQENEITFLKQRVEELESYVNNTTKLQRLIEIILEDAVRSGTRLHDMFEDLIDSILDDFDLSDFKGFDDHITEAISYHMNYFDVPSRDDVRDMICEQGSAFARDLIDSGDLKIVLE